MIVTVARKDPFGSLGRQFILLIRREDEKNTSNQIHRDENKMVVNQKKHSEIFSWSELWNWLIEWIVSSFTPKYGCNALTVSKIHFYICNAILLGCIWTRSLMQKAFFQTKKKRMSQRYTLELRQSFNGFNVPKKCLSLKNFQKTLQTVPKKLYKL